MKKIFCLFCILFCVIVLVPSHSYSYATGEQSLKLPQKQGFDFHSKILKTKIFPTIIKEFEKFDPTINTQEYAKTYSTHILTVLEKSLIDNKVMVMKPSRVSVTYMIDQNSGDEAFVLQIGLTLYDEVESIKNRLPSMLIIIKNFIIYTNVKKGMEL